MSDFDKDDLTKNTTVITKSGRSILYTAGLGGEDRIIKISKRTMSFIKTLDFYNTSLNDIKSQTNKPTMNKKIQDKQND